MNNSELQNFINDVMTLNVDYPGMGGASVAIVGASSTNNDTIFALRRNAMEFASEYSKEAPDHERLAELAGKLEGSLRSLHLLSGISEARLEQLLTALNGFVQEIFG